MNTSAILKYLQPLSVLTKNQVVRPEVIQQMASRYLKLPALDAEEVISDLCGLEIPEDKIDIFAGVCEQIRSI